MVVGSFKELFNLIILYQMMYITDWSKYSLGCMNNYYFIQNIKIRVGLGMYPGIYSFNPLSWVFYIKKNRVFCRK